MLTIVDLNRNEELSASRIRNVAGGSIGGGAQGVPNQSWRSEDHPSEEITFAYGSVGFAYGAQKG